MVFNALSIAGFDGSGGAGIQADIKAFSALGCYATCVLTALPVQNTQGVQHIYSLEPECVQQQIESIFDDITIHAIKIGMVHRSEIIHVIHAALKNYRHIPIVIDPVMIAKSGHALLSSDAIALIKRQLIPHAHLITPNIPEAEMLLQQQSIKNKDDMLSSAYKLLELGCEYVLLKGGHLMSDESPDVLVSKAEETWFTDRRINTCNTHGTGCTLSAAVTALLAQGLEMKKSVQIAKRYMTGALAAANHLNVGQGQGPVHHFYHIWPIIERI